MSYKMYNANISFNVLFIHDDKKYPHEFPLNPLERVALNYATYELNNNANTKYIQSIVEVTKVEEIPQNWMGLLYYGPNPQNQSVEEFFSSNDPEYQEYLRLKAKYE